jgi:hypothetical protein
VVAGERLYVGGPRHLPVLLAVPHIEGTAVALALALLVPLAVGLGLIEHFVPSVWLLVVLFIHVAGLPL